MHPFCTLTCIKLQKETMLQDKNTILARVILGEATEEEYLYLKENCTSEELNEILFANDLSARYRIYDSINEEKAFNKAKDILLNGEQVTPEVPAIQKKHRTLHLSLMRAAAVVLLIVAGAGYWWYNDYTKVTPPTLSQEIFAAMQTSEKQGKSEARVEKLSIGKDYSKNAVLSEEIVQELLKEVSGEAADADRRVVDVGENSIELTTTLHNKEFWLTLDDGTLVHMNADSRLIHPEVFGRGSREVFLNGEAYFMVSKDKSRPFIVHTPRGDVKVYGTEFNVNTRARDNSSDKRNCTAVVLVKGSVGVTPSEGSEFMLTPGQQIIIKEDNCSPYISNADIRPYLAWNTKKFEFDNYPLEGLMEIIYRWYNIDYVIGDPSMAKTSVSGSISRYDTIEPLLHGISKITGYDIEIKNNTIYINY